jgi:hypothetical protein
VPQGRLLVVKDSLKSPERWLTGEERERQARRELEARGRTRGASERVSGEDGTRGLPDDVICETVTVG